MGSREQRGHMDSGKPCVQLTVVKLRHMSRMALRPHTQVVFHNYKEVIIIHCIVITHFREVINSKDVLVFWGWFSLVGSFIFRIGKACFASWCKSVSMSVFVTWNHPHDFGTAPELIILLSCFFMYLWLAWYFPNKGPSDSKNSNKKHVLCAVPFWCLGSLDSGWHVPGEICGFLRLWPGTRWHRWHMHWRTRWKLWSMEIHRFIR